jgi:hypothetical protein
MLVSNLDWIIHLFTDKVLGFSSEGERASGCQPFDSIHRFESHNEKHYNSSQFLKKAHQRHRLFDCVATALLPFVRSRESLFLHHGQGEDRCVPAGKKAQHVTKGDKPWCTGNPSHITNKLKRSEVWPGKYSSRRKQDKRRVAFSRKGRAALGDEAVTSKQSRRLTIQGTGSTMV